MFSITHFPSSISYPPPPVSHLPSTIISHFPPSTFYLPLSASHFVSPNPYLPPPTFHHAPLQASTSHLPLVPTSRLPLPTCHLTLAPTSITQPFRVSSRTSAGVIASVSRCSTCSTSAAV